MAVEKVRAASPDELGYLQDNEQLRCRRLANELYTIIYDHKVAAADFRGNDANVIRETEKLYEALRQLFPESEQVNVHHIMQGGKDNSSALYYIGERRPEFLEPNMNVVYSRHDNGTGSATK